MILLSMLGCSQFCRPLSVSFFLFFFLFCLSRSLFLSLRPILFGQRAVGRTTRLLESNQHSLGRQKFLLFFLSLLAVVLSSSLSTRVTIKLLLFYFAVPCKNSPFSFVSTFQDRFSDLVKNDSSLTRNRSGFVLCQTSGFCPRRRKVLSRPLTDNRVPHSAPRRRSHRRVGLARHFSTVQCGVFLLVFTCFPICLRRALPQEQIH